MTRQDAHWKAVTWFERGMGLLLIVIGAGLALLGDGGLVQTVGAMAIGSGIWAALPRNRALISKLVDKTPGLPTKAE